MPLPESLNHPDDKVCVHCKKRIGWDRNTFTWTHRANGFALCFPFITPQDNSRATPPPPEAKSRTSGTYISNSSKPVHLVPGIEAGYRTACGKATADAVEDINQTTIKADVTCTRCQQTLKYKQMENTVPEQQYVQTDNCIHCLQPIEQRAADQSWFHSGTMGIYCSNNSARSEKATPGAKSRTSETKEPSTSDPVQAALMQIHPDLCICVYGRDWAGVRLYCTRPRGHAELCGPDKPEEVLEDKPKAAPRRSVFCVHCQIWHSPDDPHRVSFDAPPAPYVGNLFEVRAKRIQEWTADYINGKANRKDMERGIADADLAFIEGCADMHTLGLI